MWLNKDSHLQLNMTLNGKTQRHPLTEIQKREVGGFRQKSQKDESRQGRKGKSKQLVDQRC